MELTNELLSKKTSHKCKDKDTSNYLDENSLSNETFIDDEIETTQLLDIHNLHDSQEIVITNPWNSSDALPKGSVEQYGDLKNTEVMISASVFQQQIQNLRKTLTQYIPRLYF